MPRRTKIIATIGPASESREVLEKLIHAGMNLTRMNFSHGTHEGYARCISQVRDISEHLGIPVGILQDLQGPKIRVGMLESALDLREGQRVKLYAADGDLPINAEQRIPVDFPELFGAVSAGNRILMDDGRLALEVQVVEPRWLAARVTTGGRLTSHKGINLPGVDIPVPAITPKDEADLAFGIAQGVDAVAISFVRSVRDVRTARDALDRLRGNSRAPLLIAKLEKPEALAELEEILDLVDGVMVARGDLGVEMPPEKLPAVQKHIIRAANEHARLVITATQMLESMIHNALPTRAEATDVANAIFDGTDAVMLSAETAVGEYPVEAMAMMARIADEAEAHMDEWGQPADLTALGGSDAASMARAVYEIACDRDVAAIAVFTMQGGTASLISKTHPPVPILGFTPEPTTFRRLTLMRGVTPHLVPLASSVEEMLRFVDAAMIEGGMVEPGKQIVLVCGFPVGAIRTPNMALLHTVGSDLASGNPTS